MAQPAEVFLNFPFDREYEPLFITLVAGLTGLGLHPRCVLEIPDGGQGRLVRIREMLERTEISIHELGWVRTSTVNRRRVPRFNMPFELGLAVMLQARQRHRFYVLESTPRRLQATLSDLNGIDPVIHANDPKRLIVGLLGLFKNPDGAPTLSRLDELRRQLRLSAMRYKRQVEPDVFTAEGFRVLSLAAVGFAKELGLIGA